MDGKITYRASGVDIKKADSLTEKVKLCAETTYRPEVLGGVGSFNALTKIPVGYKNPVLVTCADGVGTKIRLAIEHQLYTIGQDVVAMCVNDLIVSGAEPLAFLDYYATGELDSEQAMQIIHSIAQACVQCGCALVGGETAEMPSIYKKGDYDLAGFCVGVVEEDSILGAERVKTNMKLVAIESSGCHSNGYALIRKLLAAEPSAATLEIEGRRLIEWLLTPTILYVSVVRALLQKSHIYAMAHITGGGITDNLARVLPNTLQANVDLSSWQPSGLFAWIQRASRLTTFEMLQVFNMGVGMILVVDAAAVDDVCNDIHSHAMHGWCLGDIASRARPEISVVYHN